VFNVVLRRDEVRQLVLASPMPVWSTGRWILRDNSAVILIRDAMRRLVTPQNEVIRS